MRKHAGSLDLTRPESLRVFIEKIVASHFLTLANFLQTNVEVVQWHLSRRQDLAFFAVPAAEQLWSDINAWERRLSEYQDDLEGIMLQLGIPFASRPHNGYIRSWTDSTADFQHLRLQYREIGQRVHALADTIATLANLAGNRAVSRLAEQSLYEAERAGHEARSLKALTILGIVFLPLSFVATLLSMADAYLPGSPMFWLYFVLSLPLLGVVIIVYSGAELGYEDGHTQWSLKTAIANVQRKLS